MPVVIRRAGRKIRPRGLNVLRDRNPGQCSRCASVARRGPVLEIGGSARPVRIDVAVHHRRVGGNGTGRQGLHDGCRLGGGSREGHVASIACPAAVARHNAVVIRRAGRKIRPRGLNVLRDRNPGQCSRRASVARRGPVLEIGGSARPVRIDVAVHHRRVGGDGTGRQGLHDRRRLGGGSVVKDASPP